MFLEMVESLCPISGSSNFIQQRREALLQHMRCVDYALHACGLWNKARSAFRRVHAVPICFIL